MNILYFNAWLFSDTFMFCSAAVWIILSNAGFSSVVIY